METQYKLELPPDKKRVFVTQLREDEDEEEYNGYETIQKIPIVKQKAGQLIEIGFNTLQSTLLLKREHDARLFDVEFQKKRLELNLRIDKCRENEKKFNEKELAFKKRIESFSKYIEENNKKKEHAFYKYQKEELQKRLKLKEAEEAHSEILRLKQRCELLKCKVVDYSKFEEFLCKVVDVLPADYIESSDDMINGLIKRYETLENTSISLKTSIEQNNQQIDDCSSIIQNLSFQQAQKLTICNREMILSKKKSDKLELRNKVKEHRSEQQRQLYRDYSQSLGTIYLAIENLSHLCGIDNEQLSVFQKLDKVMVYLAERKSVYLMASGTDDNVLKKNNVLKTNATPKSESKTSVKFE